MIARVVAVISKEELAQIPGKHDEDTYVWYICQQLAEADVEAVYADENGSIEVDLRCGQRKEN